jgi:TRAP transporter 4TM/12TM fusion protein
MRMREHNEGKGGSVFKKRLFQWMGVVTAVIGVAMTLYQLVITQILFLPFDLSKVLHLGFGLVLVFLSKAKEEEKYWWLNPVLILCAVFVTLYCFVFYDGLMMRIGLPIPEDIIFAVLLILIVLEATRRAFGLVLPIFCLVWIAYGIFGHSIPGVLHVPYFSAEHIITKMALDFTGVYGQILGISLSYIFLFIVFGALMKATGTVKFFEQIGRLTGRTFRGGTALSAISTSALFGMVTGAASSNVVLTGSFTIPAMKRAGFKPEQAGAIEASASTVGQVMPPVMGAAAFLMADFVEKPYSYICWIAILPALYTFFGMAIYVQLQAMKLRLSPPVGGIDYGQLLRFSYLFVIPLFVLIFLLAKGYSPSYAVFWTIMLLVALSMLRKESRLPLKTWMNAVVDGAVMGSGIAVMCAATGIVVSIIIMSGLGIKFPAAIESISGGNLIVILFLTMLVTLILGCGMPTTAAYMLVALVVAPALTKSGVAIVSAHFFVFFYACFSLVTPPVAPAAVTASALAHGKFFRTGVEATKVSAAAFILPFFMLRCPVLFLQPESLWKGIADLVSIALLLVAAEVATVGYYLVICCNRERLFMGASAGCVAIYLFNGINSLPVGLVGLVIFLSLTGLQIYKRSQSMRTASSHTEVPTLLNEGQ